MRAVLIGDGAWREPLARSLAAVGIGSSGADTVEGAVAEAGEADVAFFDVSKDPLRAVSTLWWVAPHLPVVLSGCGHPDLVEAAREAGIPVVGPCPAPAYLAGVLDSLTVRGAGNDPALAAAMVHLCELGARSAPFADSTAAQVIADLFQADTVSVMLVGDDGVLRTVCNVGHGDVVGRPAPAHGVGEHIVRTGTARLLIGGGRGMPGLDDAPQSEVQASVMAPIRHGDNVRGVLAVGKRRQHAVFTPRDLEVADALASLLGEVLARGDADRDAAELERRLQATERLNLLGELAAGVVHDVASPLGAVRSNVEALISHLAALRPLLEEMASSADGVDSMLDELPELLCETYEGLSRANDVIRQMRQVARLGCTGEGEAVDVAAAIESAVRMLRSRVRIPITVIVEERRHIRGIAVELLQVLTNLLANANDACVERQRAAAERGEGYKPQIVVELKKDAPEGEVVVAVRDNGVGMSPEVVARMWQTLFTTKPVGQGTGLGMGIVQRVVQQHGGRVEVSSALGAGTELVLVFPRAAVAAEHRALP